jgi:cysteinyl-tRNA synthetase
MSLLGADPLNPQGRDTELPINATMSTETLPSPATTLNPSIEEDSLVTRIPPQLIDTLLAVRAELRSAKQWAFADKLRNALTEFGIVVQDTPDGTRWSIPEEE